MKRRYLVLLSALTALVISCHKDHNNPPVTPGPPSLSTVPVTDITDTTAMSGGTFTNQGTMTINFKGVQWDTGSQFLNHWTSSAGDGTGNFTAGISGLFPNTLYYVRAYAGTDSADIWYGNTLIFITTYNLGKYLVSTVAGTGAAGAVNGDTSIATFNAPFGVAVDLSGNIFVADSKNNAIREITPSGTVSTFASLAGTPNDVITDSAGNVYVAENDFKIIKITASGQAAVFAGSGQQGHADGIGAAASFYFPLTLGIDPAGNLYVADLNAFRKITPSGVVSTLTNYFTTTNACKAVAADKNYDFYESDGNTIFKADTLGNETILVSKSFGYISEIRLDNTGNLYMADVTDNMVRMMTPAGVASIMAGTGTAGAKDGNSAIATFSGPIGLAPDNSGNIIIADANNNKIRKISPL